MIQENFPFQKKKIKEKMSVKNFKLIRPNETCPTVPAINQRFGTP